MTDLTPLIFPPQEWMPPEFFPFPDPNTVPDVAPVEDKDTAPVGFDQETVGVAHPNEPEPAEMQQDNEPVGVLQQDNPTTVTTDTETEENLLID